MGFNSPAGRLFGKLCLPAGKLGCNEVSHLVAMVTLILLIALALIDCPHALPFIIEWRGVQ